MKQSSSKSTPAKQASTQQKQRLGWLERYIPYLLIAAGALGTFASFMLAIEEIDHLKHPAAKLACDLNPVVGCGANMDTWQGHVLFGIPNQFIGLIVFAAVATIGFAILAGGKFRRWFWLGLQAGLLFGLVFVHWFMYESLAVIKHLCPYCMLTWVAVITAFWYTTLYNIRSGTIRLGKRHDQIASFLERHHADIIAAWFLVILGLILWRFWYYWQTVI